jgi:hypothetical protein
LRKSGKYLRKSGQYFRNPTRMARPYPGSSHPRVVFDEVAPRLNILAHQLGEDGFGLPLFLDHRRFVQTHKKD